MGQPLSSIPDVGYYGNAPDNTVDGKDFESIIRKEYRSLFEKAKFGFTSITCYKEISGFFIEPAHKNSRFAPLRYRNTGSNGRRMGFFKGKIVTKVDLRTAQNILTKRRASAKNRGASTPKSIVPGFDILLRGSN